MTINVIGTLWSPIALTCQVTFENIPTKNDFISNLILVQNFISIQDILNQDKVQKCTNY